ncbi:VMAP-C domain-containing protein [Streptomyces zagrosensis]|uniref:vWA-MoxR associated protein C-terminal domain-containing protein n=1 Tax=Streptomyces zagrosensis TaxID=1042984 RepID=A0A7W9Q9T0_9ACTN|nr:trypsin-like peptidase domain-containing protein [Streptomyces zagrosensis]MBB5936266.1 hypothetical protein [Streptomyces zagrosensis]
MPAKGAGRPVLVSVLTLAEQRSVGSGVLLPGQRFVTCAHVINSARAQRKEATGHPEPTDFPVRVHGPGGPHERLARLLVWVPPGPGCETGALEWDGDLAVLELTEELPGQVRPPRWAAMAEGQAVHAWHCAGHEATRARARVWSCDGRIGYVDGESLAGADIDEGYSGGPLWSGSDGAVVGLVAGALSAPVEPSGRSLPYSPRHVARRGWGIPWQRVRAELAAVQAEWLLSGAEQVGGANGARTGRPEPHDPIRRDLAGAIARALPDPQWRTECARLVVDECARPAPDRDDGTYQAGPGVGLGGGAAKAAGSSTVRTAADERGGNHSNHNRRSGHDRHDGYDGYDRCANYGDHKGSWVPASERVQVAERVEVGYAHGPQDDDWCGVGASPISAHVFAGLLLAQERALAALTELLHPAAPGATAELLALGRVSKVPRLLSPGELDSLCRVLSRLPANTLDWLPSATRAALSVAGVSLAPEGETAWGDRAAPADVAGIAALVRHLETLPGDSHPVPDGTSAVPGLLRMVEYLAAVCPVPARAELRGWCAGVASRIGIHASALKERRADAHQWAEAQLAPSPPPRVLVRLTRYRDENSAPAVNTVHAANTVLNTATTVHAANTAQGAHSGGGAANGEVGSGQASGERYQLRMWCDEGEGPRQVGEDSERPRGAVEAAQEILAVLGPLHRLRTEGSRPVIEILVDRDALDLPVDEWQVPGPGGLLVGVLGAEYPLVVNCPELVRRGDERYAADWRHRWQQLDQAETVRLGPATGGTNEVYGLLLARPDAARVAVGDVPPALRTTIVQVCLAMGVPVVLWYRDQPPASAAAQRELEAPVRHLPERVRAYRASTLAQPDAYVGRPALAWADADRPPPRLELADPTRPV